MIEELIMIFSAILTYTLGKLSKKFNWNETLPIPMQNILVGFIVFVIVLIYKKATGSEILIENLMQEIYYALGGSGVATLLYDTNKATNEYK